METDKCFTSSHFQDVLDILSQSSVYIWLNKLNQFSFQRGNFETQFHYA